MKGGGRYAFHSGPEWDLQKGLGFVVGGDADSDKE